MNINIKKGLILIAIALIGGLIAGIIFRFIRIPFFSLIASIAQLGLIIVGVLQMLGKFNIDQYFDMNKYLNINDEDISENDNETFFTNQDTINKTTKVEENLNREIKNNINQLNLNNMDYKVEQIGAEFSNKGIKNLESRFNSFADQGYKFHSVFEVQKPGCLGFGSPSITYLAVYVKE